MLDSTSGGASGDTTPPTRARGENQKLVLVPSTSPTARQLLFQSDGAGASNTSTPTQNMQVRKLTLTTSNSKDDTDSPKSAPGLPTLLRKIRLDAQQQVLRETVEERLMATILRDELEHVETESASMPTIAAAAMAALQVELAAMDDELSAALTEVAKREETIRNLESTNAALAREMHEVRSESAKALEYANAMEAADAFLSCGSEEDALNELDLSEEHIVRIGSHSGYGTVALANVPAINGGCRLPGAAAFDGDGTAVEAGGAQGAVRGRAANASNKLVFGLPAPSSEMLGVRGAVHRKLSFKRASRLVRSLSFG